MQNLVKAARVGTCFASCLFVAAGAFRSFEWKRSVTITVPRVYAGMTEKQARVFDRACKDCHSNDTDWPWYSKIPPVSLGVVADVRRGRATWNISAWSTYSKGKKLGFLSAIAMDASNDNMPPRAYRWMHRDSELSKVDRVLLKQWAETEQARLRGITPRQPLGSPIASK